MDKGGTGVRERAKTRDRSKGKYGEEAGMLEQRNIHQLWCNLLKVDSINQELLETLLKLE